MAIPPTPWTVEVDDYAYEVRVRSADGRTVCVVPMSVRVTHHEHAPQGIKRTVDRESALEVAHLLADAPRSRGDLNVLLRKLSHGCIDMPCSHCDGN